jgi:hypothetical protein
MQRVKSGEPPACSRPMARVTFLLGAALISVALLIGIISYQYSFQMMERSYQSFYLNKAQMLVTVAEPFLKSGDQDLLKFFDRYWEAAGNRPPDEYICVVDKIGNLRDAAKSLGVSHPTVLRKAQKLGLQHGGDSGPESLH